MTSPPPSAPPPAAAAAPLPAAGGALGFSLPSLLAGAWRWRWLVVLACLCGAAVGVFRGLTTPNLFASSGKLFVRPSARESITPEAAFSGALGGAARSASVRESIMNELQLLAAPELYTKIVDKLGVDAVLAPYDPAGEPLGEVPWHTRLFHLFQSWWFAGSSSAIERSGIDRQRMAELVVANGVNIAPEPGTSVIVVSFVSHDPEIARQVVDAVLAAAVAMHGEVFDKMSPVGAIEEELRSAEAAARAAEEELRKFRVAKLVYDFETQRNSQLRALDELDQQIDSLDLEVSRKTAERDALTAIKQGVSRERKAVGSGQPVVNPNVAALFGTLQQIRTMLLQLEVQKTGLAAEEYSRQKGLLTTELAELEAIRRQEPLRLNLGDVLESNPYFDDLTQRIDGLDAELKAATAQRQRLVAIRTNKRSDLASFEALAPELRVLDLDARQKREKADRLAGGVASMRAIQRAEQLNLSSLQILHQGTYEPDKIGPSRSRWVVFGGIGGAMAGMALALLLAFAEPRVRNRHDLAAQGVGAVAVLGAAKPAAAALGDAAAGALPAALREAAADVAALWTTLPYDRRDPAGVAIAFVPCGTGVAAARAAACMALGLAVHGGERVAYVAATSDDSWLAQRLGVAGHLGWADVVAGRAAAAAAVVATAVPGLDYVPVGTVTAGALPHPLASPAFVALLDGLLRSHRFVVLDLPELQVRPEAQAVLKVVDGVQLVAAGEASTKAAVRAAVARVAASGARLLGAVLEAPPPAAAPAAGQPPA